MQNIQTTQPLFTDDKDIYGTVQVLKDKIAGYILRRSYTSPMLVNVIAVNSNDEMLVVVESDLPFDEGAEMVEKLNAVI